MGQISSEKKELEQDIAEALSAVRMTPAADLCSALLTYVAEMEKWGSRTNLTGSARGDRFVRGPLFDALTLLSLLRTPGTLVDIGSGGGLPGIPIAIAHRAVRVTLVEPRGKRAAFLRHMTALLNLDAEVRQCRLEDLPNESWDYAVAQAVWPPDEWLRRAFRLVAARGSVYALLAKPLALTEIPARVQTAEQVQFQRPWDNATRYVTRLVKLDQP